MANFNVNQVRQLYVAKTAPAEITKETNIQTTLANPGDFGYSEMDSEGNFYFISRGATGELVRSDMINAKSIKHITYVDKSTDVYKLKRTKITMLSTVNSGNPIAGEDYEIVLNFTNVLGFGVEDTHVEIGSAHAVTGMTAAQLLGELAVSLYLNLPEGIVSVYCGSTLLNETNVAAHKAGTAITGNYIILEEVEQPWVRGTKSAIVYPFTVTCKYVKLNNDIVPWATVNPNETTVTSIKNTKRIADLEYFCMGERGDWYRNVGWPHVVPTSYLVPVDSSDTGGYNVLTIHYKFIGGGDEAASRLSVKDIQIVSTASLESLKGIIEGYQKEAYTGPSESESEEGEGGGN